MGLVTGATVKKNFFKCVTVFIPWLESSICISIGNLKGHYGYIKSKLRKNLVIVILSRVVLII